MSKVVSIGRGSRGSLEDILNREIFIPLADKHGVFEGDEAIESLNLPLPTKMDLFDPFGELPRNNRSDRSIGFSCTHDMPPDEDEY